MVDDKLNRDMSEEDAKRSDREAVLPDNAPNDHTVKVNVRPSGRMPRSSGTGTPPETSTTSVWSLVALAIALVASAGLAYVYVEQQRIDQQFVSIPAELARNQLAIAELRALQTSGNQAAKTTSVELSSLAARMGDFEDQVNAVDPNVILSKVDDALVAQRAEVRELMGPAREDWLLAESEYLLRLASQRLLMDRDVPSAIALIQSADDTLADARGLKIFELRASLAEDLASLGAVAELDTEGIFLRLNALISRVDVLQQRQLTYRKDVQALPETQVDGSVTLIQRLTGMLSAIGDQIAGLVDYRVSDERIRPVLPAKEEYYLRQNLVMKYQLAQLALLRGKQEIFVASVGDARVWVSRYFDDQDVETSAVLTTLNDLENIDITREIPDVSVSLRLVREVQRRGEPSIDGAGDGA